MSEETQSKALRHWFTMGAVAVVLWAIWLVVRPLAVPIAWAAILAFLLHPLQLALTRRFRGSRTAAAATLTGLTPVAIFAPLTLIGIEFAQQIGALSESLQDHREWFTFATWLDPVAHPHIARMAEWTSAHLHVSTPELSNQLLARLELWATALAKSSGQVFLGTAGLLLKFVVMLFILFFFLRDGEVGFRRVIDLLPLANHRRDALFARLGKVLRAVVYGCGLTAIMQGTLVSIGFAITGLPGPIVFGVLATVLALLPFGGAAIVWVPGMLYLFATGNVGMSVFLLVWGGIVSTSDNFVRPVIISRYTPVPTLLVFVGVIGGVAAFGTIGFIVGPVILVLATELLRYAEGSLARGD